MRYIRVLAEPLYVLNRLEVVSCMGKRKEILYYNNRLCGKYLSSEDCDRLEALMRLDAAKGSVADLEDIICDLPPSVVEVIKGFGSNDGVDLSQYPGKLEKHQTIGVAYMYFAKRLVLGDSVGIGKTVEVCGLCNLLERLYEKKGREFRFLYLTEKTLVPQAQSEIIKFTGNFVYALYGEKAKVNEFIDENYASLNYSVVGTHSLINSVPFQEYMRGFIADTGTIPFDLLVIDESGDILSNSSTATYKNAMFFGSFFERIVLLNATSFEKELRAFYSQLNFVDDSFLPTKTAFQKEYEVYNYFTPYPTFSGKYKNADKFRDLVSYRYLARTRKSSGAIMEDCTAEVVVVPLSREQKWLLGRTSMPQMVYDCPSYFSMGVETNESTTPKVKALIRLITEDLRDVRSILVYSRYKESQKCIDGILYDLGIKSAIMNGDSPQEVREAIIDKFKLGDIRVLITNVQKGLNFGNCNHCIFYTYDPNPNKMVQFEGRMTRSFNIVGKHVYLLLSEGKELSTFNSIIADRARASDVFAGSDFSCVLSLLLSSGRGGESGEISNTGCAVVSSGDGKVRVVEDEICVPDGDLV